MKLPSTSELVAGEESSNAGSYLVGLKDEADILKDKLN